LPDLETWVVLADGSGVTRPLPNGCELDWSPEATRIVFRRPCDFPFADIWVANADGPNATRIAQRGQAPDRHPLG
jgi:hypothetical protein